MVYRSVAHSLNTSTTSVPAATASLEMSVPRAGPTDGATAKWPHPSPPGTPLWQTLLAMCGNDSWPRLLCGYAHKLKRPKLQLCDDNTVRRAMLGLY